jgi:class 3 adenylate cyclase
MPEASQPSFPPFLRALIPWAAWLSASAAAGAFLSLAFRNADVFWWAAGATAAAILLFRWAYDAYRLLFVMDLFYRHHMLPAVLERPLMLWPWAPALGLRRVLRAAVHEYQKAVKRTREATLALEKFVGAGAAERSIRAAAKPAMVGESKKVFCLFADVRGFTHMTEKLRPEETVDILNRIFTELDAVIAQYGGEINKYIGDAVFAYFRCPYDNEESAARNVLRAALRMQEAFDTLNVRIRNASYSAPVEIGLGIGLTVGTAVVGSMGGANRMEFTLIGDVVNLASRLCSIAKSTEVLVNEEMAEMVQEYFDMTSQPPVELKGKSGMQVPYVVVGERMLLTKGLSERGKSL